MTSTPANPDESPLDGTDLAELRAEIDALQAIPEEDLISPPPGEFLEDGTDAETPERELEPEPTEAPGAAFVEPAEPTTPAPRSTHSQE